MKKILFYLTSIIIIIFLEILFSRISVLGLIFVIFIGLYRGSASGCSIGFIIGLVDGIFSASTFGIFSFSYAVIGYVAGRIAKRIDEENPLAQIIIVFLGILLNKVVSMILEMIFTANKGLFYIGWTTIFIVLTPLFFVIFKKWWFKWFKRLNVER